MTHAVSTVDFKERLVTSRQHLPSTSLFNQRHFVGTSRPKSRHQHDCCESLLVATKVVHCVLVAATMAVPSDRAHNGLLTRPIRPKALQVENRLESPGRSPSPPQKGEQAHRKSCCGSDVSDLECEPSRRLDGARPQHSSSVVPLPLQTRSVPCKTFSCPVNPSQTVRTVFKPSSRPKEVRRSRRFRRKVTKIFNPPSCVT